MEPLWNVAGRSWRLKARLYGVDMKTLSVTEGRQNLGAWLKRALQGEDVGIVVEGRVVALRPMEVHSDDHILQEYGASEEQAERAHRKVKTDVRRARKSGQTKRFTGKL